MGWGLETEAEVLIASDLAELDDQDDMASFYMRTGRPLLIIHCDDDHLAPLESSQSPARLTAGTLVTLTGSGHCPDLRDPVKVNLLIRDFVE